MPLPPNTRLGRYEIRSQLGAGGMGEVYLAQDTSELGRAVALKILPSEVAADKDRLQRFIQEARTVSNLNHPNILTVHEFGQTDSASFMATEYVDGVTLRQHLSQRRLKLVDVLDVAIQIVAALNAAHEAGVTHRDLKPENVMIRRDQIVKVLDFGLAKPAAKAAARQVDSEAGTKVLVQTEPGLVMGTVGYMSPEQSSGAAVDQRTDIWSVGVVLYEMIAGRLPFQGKDIHRQIIAIQEAEPEPLARYVEGVPGRLEEIVAKCLAKDKDERYQTAKDLLIDLRNLRRKLDVEAEIERTVAPAFRATSGGASGASTQGARTDVGATTAAHAHPTSSAEYVVTSIKQHKLATGLVVLTLVAGIIGFGLYFRAGTNVTAIKSIAVMPFVNQSGNADVEYLSDGMTETLIKSLSQVPNLSVKARSTVFYYKGKETSPKKIGEELNVQAVLLGRVAGRGDELKLSLELVNTQTQDVIWSEQYDRKQSDLVALQSEIARDVSSKLKLRLSGADEAKVTKTSTADPEAYQAYLKGRYYWNRRTSENLKKAIAQFKIATDRDPNYALAFAGLADCYALLNEYSGVPVTEAAPQAKAYAERAIAIDESLAEPHATLGTINKQLWQWAEAEKEFKRAIELNPNYATTYHWYSIMLIYLGRKDESLAMIQRAHELDPLSSIIMAALSWVQAMRDDFQASTDTLFKLIEIDPNFGIAYDNLGLLYLKTGRNAEAVAAFEKAAQLTDRYSVVLSSLGYAYTATGKRTEALAIIKELEEKYTRKEANGLSVAAVYAGLGDNDKAFEWLEKDFQNRDGLLPDITVSIPLESLRDDPRFKDLLRRMNLPE
jgi:serine/threonine-protein kinase